MDKNTVIGMLLMCAVIFGFMYLQPKDENAQNSQQQAANTEQKASQEAAKASVDTLTSAEMTLLDSLTAKNGAITFEGVNLTNQDGKATGTVKIEGKTIDFASLAMPKSDDPKCQSHRREHNCKT